MSGHDAYNPAPRRLPRATGGLSRRQLLGLSHTKLGVAPVDYARLTERLAQAWDGEARTMLLRALQPVADTVAGVAAVGPATRVLDVGAGDGNVALACVARGARVAACDLAPSMLRRGRERTGTDVTWRHADAQRLPYPEASFDVVVSAFGVSEAPRADRAARELARVCRPGGRVVLAAWVPRGLPGRMAELVDAVDPLPDGVPTSAIWGRPDSATRLLAGHLDELTLRTCIVTLRFANPDACFDAMAPSMLDSAQRAALRPLFDRLLASVNNRPPLVEIDARYLLASGVARGAHSAPTSA